MLENYVPPEIPGMVFASNYGNVDIVTKIPHTEQSVRTDCAKWLGISEDEVCVIRFNPDNSNSPYGIGFATYVNNKYGDLIEAKHEHLKILLSVLDLDEEG